jgi:hypothetical protein
LKASYDRQGTISGPTPEVHHAVQRAATSFSLRKMVGGGGDIGDHDPLIVGLFRKLPEPEADWPAAARLKWLQTAANNFGLIYKGEGGIVVSLARAERSPPAHDE